jgi:hypothetical protein
MKAKKTIPPIAYGRPRKYVEVYEAMSVLAVGQGLQPQGLTRVQLRNIVRSANRAMAGRRYVSRTTPSGGHFIWRAE